MRNPGKLVKHEDGREGIVYDSEQRQEYHDEGKEIVRFFENNRELSKQKRKVKYERLKIIGFVD